MITFSHIRVSGQYSKAFIQFTSDGQPGEIIFERRYYGTGFNQNIKFFFFSRVIWGREDVHFNHAIFDLTESSDNQNVLYFENIGMNKNKIYGLDDPENNSEAANKNYVDSENSKQDIAIADKATKSYLDSEIAKIPGPQNVLLLDGSKAMTGDLKIGDNNLIGLKNLTDYKVDDPLQTSVVQ